MRRYTERMCFAVPVAVKAEMKAPAAELGISLSEFIRRAADPEHLQRKASKP